MSTSSIRIGVGLAGAAFLSLVAAVTVALADAEPKPVAGISNIMIAVNDDKDGMFAQVKAFIASNPGKDKSDEFKLNRHRVQVMAECGNVLMTKSPPRGGDDAAGMAKWKQHCADYRECCKTLSKALAMKKTEDAVEGVKAVEARCQACHDDHRPK
jgi:hypothetical protein